jgi:hypothetical protein
MGMGQAGGVVGWLVLCVFWVTRYAEALAGVWCAGIFGCQGAVYTVCSAELPDAGACRVSYSFSTTSRLRLCTCALVRHAC